MGNRRALGLAASKPDTHFGYNLQNGLANYMTALAKYASQQVRIHVIGDSVAWGVNASNAESTSWPMVLRDRLQHKYGNGDYGYLSIASGLSASGDGVTWGWSYGGAGWDWDATGTCSGGSTPNTISTTSSSITTYINATIAGITGFDLEFVKHSGGGTATVTVDGSNQGTVDCSGSGTDVISIRGLTTGSHTVTITPNGDGIISMGGVWIYQSKTSGIVIAKLAASSATATMYEAILPPIGTWDSHPCDLAIIELGLNDQGSISAIVDDMPRIGKIISYWQSSGASVLLLAWYTPNDSWTYYWPEMQKAYYELADQYNCALLNLAQAIPSWEVMAYIYKYLGLTSALTNPTMPTSGTSYANPNEFTCRVYVSSGTVTEIAINGTSTGLASGEFTLFPTDTITLTYSVAPTWQWFGLSPDEVHPYDNGYLLVSRLIEPTLVLAP